MCLKASTEERRKDGCLTSLRRDPASMEESLRGLLINRGRSLLRSEGVLRRGFRKDWERMREASLKLGLVTSVNCHLRLSSTFISSSLTYTAHRTFGPRLRRDGQLYVECSAYARDLLSYARVGHLHPFFATILFLPCTELSSTFFQTSGKGQATRLGDLHECSKEMADGCAG